MTTFLLLLINSVLVSVCYCRLECMLTHSGREYEGFENQTTTGHWCQRWDSQTPHSHMYTNPISYPDETVSDAKNYCRNPDQEWNGGTWCYTTTQNKRWGRCNVPLCECKTDVAGHQYLGINTTTQSGRTCQYWDSQSPHAHNFTDSDFPDHELLDASNKCRNPRSARPLGPWCYTSDPEPEWEYCSIPLCDESSTTEQDETTPEQEKPSTGADRIEFTKSQDGKSQKNKNGVTPKTGASTESLRRGLGAGVITAIVISLLFVIIASVIGIWWRFYRVRPELPNDKVKFENFDNPLYNKPQQASSS